MAPRRAPFVRHAPALALAGLALCLLATDALPRPLRHLGRFALTYYFVAEQRSPGTLPLYAAACRATIARVNEDFLLRLSREGTGRLRDGRVVNFLESCGCAPPGFRGARYCYEVLDPVRFPWGRGARLGKGYAPLRPLRTLAVDPALVPLGSTVFLPELRGRPGPDGRLHDGCLRAEDTGSMVRGRTVDLFAGRPDWARWLQRTHRLREVSLVLNDPRCGAGDPARG